MSGHTVLVVAQAQDGTADLVVDALLARQANVARIDTADFPGSLFLAASPERIDSPGWLRSCGRHIDLASVSSVYRRQPAHFVFPQGMTVAERRFATLESTYGLGGVLSAQPWRWIDHPAVVADAWVPKAFDVRLTVVGGTGLPIADELVGAA